MTRPDPNPSQVAWAARVMAQHAAVVAIQRRIARNRHARLLMENALTSSHPRGTMEAKPCGRLSQSSLEQE